MVSTFPPTFDNVKGMVRVSPGKVERPKYVVESLMALESVMLPRSRSIDCRIIFFETLA